MRRLSNREVVAAGCHLDFHLNAMKPAQDARPTNKPPAAALRDLIVTYFNEDEVRSLAFDLGLDYESLSGTGKIGKSGALIQQAARNSKVIDLVQQCRSLRPEANWNDVGVAVATNPQQFLFVPDDQPLINTSPQRALRLGIMAGVILALVLVCGFSGGLAAGQVVAVTLRPVQPDQESLKHVNFEVGRIKFTPQSVRSNFSDVATGLTNGSLLTNTSVGVTLNETQTTTLIDNVVQASASAPMREPHVHLLGNGQVSLSFLLPGLGNQRVALAYTMQASGGRLILKAESGWLNVVNIPGTTFGWVPLPTSVTGLVTSWVQAQLDAKTHGLAFTQVAVSPGSISIDAKTR